MSRPEIRVVPIDSVCPDPINPRYDLGDLTSFTEDIAASGIQTPLTVRAGSHGRTEGKCGDCGQSVPRVSSGVLAEHDHHNVPCPGGSMLPCDEWWILDGHRRHQAAMDAGLRDVPIIVNTDVRSDADALMFMIRSSVHRRDLTPLEEAHAFQQLELFGVTATRIAQQTRQPIGKVKGRRRLLDLTDSAKADLKAGRMTLDDAHALLDLPPERADQALRSIGTRSFRQEVARHELAMVSSEPTDAEVAAKLRENFLAPYLDGLARPVESGPLKRAWLDALALGLPARLSRKWMGLLGLEDPSEVTHVAFARAMTALAVCLSDDRSIYDLLGALGYDMSPVETELLEGA